MHASDIDELEAYDVVAVVDRSWSRHGETVNVEHGGGQSEQAQNLKEKTLPNSLMRGKTVFYLGYR